MLCEDLFGEQVKELEECTAYEDNQIALIANLSKSALGEFELD